MKKMDIAIIEDNEKDVEKLLGALSEYASYHPEYDFKVKTFNGGIPFFEGNSGFDVVFVDIEMPTMDGMEVCRKLREFDKNVAIIFVTNMTQYAIDGYSVNAFDFIVKPFNYNSFAMRFDRLMQSLVRFTDKKIKIKSRGGATITLPLPKIKYVEVFNNRLVYHTFDGDIDVTSSLSEIEPTLFAHGFFKVSRSLIVNLRHVNEVSDDEINVDGAKLYIARRRKKEFMQALTEYLGDSDV